MNNVDHVFILLILALVAGQVVKASVLCLKIQFIISIIDCTGQMWMNESLIVIQ